MKSSAALPPPGGADDIERPPPTLLRPTESTKALRPIGSGALATPWTDANPWTDAYLERELASMMVWLPKSMAYGDAEKHVALSQRKSTGIVDCYMREDFLDWGPFAHFQIDKAVWMSLTPMEIESQYMPIMLATGRVGVGGLGLGYATLRMASKPDVHEVVVYEHNPMVVHLWERAVVPNAPTSWVSKVRIIEGDLTTLRGAEFDFFYNDIYERMLEQDAIAHWPMLCERNNFGGYHFWGLECWLLPFVLTNQKHRVPFYLRNTYFPFFKQLFEAVESGHGIFGNAKVGSYPHIQRDVRTYLKGTEVWPE